ncbi:MAG: DUF1801 domain-containing protein [Myxococcaceae bacterium]|nr:DUF1801 domain-containing protein [Myxococcaceae bacterium]
MHPRVAAYLKKQPAPVRRAVETLRALVFTVAPEAQEGFAYQMPSYSLGQNLAYLAGWTTHVALYGPVTMAKDLEAKTAKYRSGKGTLKFPLDAPLPVALVKQLLRARVKTLRQGSAKKPARR